MPLSSEALAVNRVCAAGLNHVERIDDGQPVGAGDSDFEGMRPWRQPDFLEQLDLVLRGRRVEGILAESVTVQIHKGGSPLGPGVPNPAHACAAELERRALTEDVTLRRAGAAPQIAA